MKTVYILYPFLIINTVTDIFKRRICIWSVIITGAFGIAAVFTESGRTLLFKESGTIISLGEGALFGGMLLAISVLSDKSIGPGDGLVAAVLGWYLGIYSVLLLFMLSFLLSGLCGILLIILKKAGRKDRLPLMPFILLSYTALLLAKN